MGIEDVWDFLRQREIDVPRRTDCARCYHQRIGEWWDLWNEYPEIYADAEAQEEEIGHTFRSPGRDTWPVGLRELRAVFERGRTPTSVRKRAQLPLFVDVESEDICRICRL